LRKAQCRCRRFANGVRPHPFSSYPWRLGLTSVARPKRQVCGQCLSMPGAAPLPVPRCCPEVRVAALRQPVHTQPRGSHGEAGTDATRPLGFVELHRRLRLGPKMFQSPTAAKGRVVAVQFPRTSSSRSDLGSYGDGLMSNVPSLTRSASTGAAPWAAGCSGCMVGFDGASRWQFVTHGLSHESRGGASRDSVRDEASLPGRGCRALLSAPPTGGHAAGPCRFVLRGRAGRGGVVLANEGDR
jgi:hypothetical protein